MKKNTASQRIGAQMVSAADGSAFTGSVTVYVTIDGGTQAIGTVGSGICTHEGNGFHTYAPSQAETNGDHLAFTFIGSGAVPGTVQVFTGFPQAGDASASNIKKNQALQKFAFVMTDSTTHAPATGKTVTCTRSIDGGAFGADTLASVTEVANGVYTVDFGAADLNGNVIVLRCTATDCDDTLERIVTQP